MKLVIMTKPIFFVEEDKILVSLFERGMDSLHIGKSTFPPVYYERLLSLIPEEYHGKITIHDHFYLKDEYRLAGIHLSDMNRMSAVPAGYKGRIGMTCKDMSQLKEAKRMSSYVFLSFADEDASVTKKKALFASSDIVAASRSGLIDKKVYAYGGMSADNIKAARDLGFGGVVVCDDIWGRFDIHNQHDYSELISHFEKLRKITN